jgi:tol-pal system protein YbgF
MAVMKSIRLTCLTAILVWGMTGCASQSDIRILEDRVNALERQNLELQQQTAENIDAKASALRTQSASLHAATDQVRNEIQVLNGKLEETRYQLAEQTRASEYLDRRVGRIEEKLNLPVLKDAPRPSSSGNMSLPGAPPAAAQPPAAAAGPASENELYTLAKQAFDRGDYQEARDGFQKLLLQYPKAKNANNAQFWIGETFYRQKEYEQAILEYQTAIEKYPGGNKVQASLLKQGFAFAGMGDKANARLILQELIEKYPDSSEAKIARQKMSTL